MMSLLTELNPLLFLIFAFQGFQNSILRGPLCIMFWSVKYTFTCQR